MILQLFSNVSIFSLLDILFVDMTDDHKIFDEAIQLAEEKKNQEENALDEEAKSPNIRETVGSSTTLFNIEK